MAGSLFWLSDDAWARVGRQLPTNKADAKRVDYQRVISGINAAAMLIDDATRFRRLIADRGYDAGRFRAALRKAGKISVIPGRSNRKRRIRHDERRYAARWRIEAMFGRLKEFADAALRVRRLATGYDKLAEIFFSAAALVAVVAFWT